MYLGKNIMEWGDDDTSVGVGLTNNTCALDSQSTKY